MADLQRTNELLLEKNGGLEARLTAACFILGLSSACIVCSWLHMIYLCMPCIALPSQRAHKRLVNVYITFTIAFRVGSECPFIERLVLVKTFS